MPNPAFLIEGHMEKLILRKICPGFPARRIGCNGDDVEMAVLAKFIDTQIRLFNNRHYPIIIIFDRERRPSSCDKLRRELTNVLNDLGHDNIDFRIAIADRTVENWILGDPGNIRSVLGVQFEDRNFEGTFGKGELRKILGRSIPYHETTNGVELFFKSDPKQVRQNSKSFRRLFSIIDFRCSWLNN